MNQHYVPQFILEGFVNPTDPGNLGVWVYHAKYRTWRKRSTGSTTSLEDFYSLVETDGTRDDTVENLLHEVETPMALLLTREIAERHPIASRPLYNDLFITFCAHLLARNPLTVSRVKDVVAREAHKVIEEIARTPELFEQERESYEAPTGREFPRQDTLARIGTDFQLSTTKAGALTAAVATASVVAEKLAEMSVDFLFAPADGPTYITADVPYVTFPKADGSGLEQVVVPLSPSIAAVFNEAEAPAYRYVDAAAVTVRTINLAMLTAADMMIVSFSPDIMPKDFLDKWAVSSPDERSRLVEAQAILEAGA